jgi:IS605 OrfB family transposase
VKALNGLLNKQARAVNFVWNFCGDTQKHALKWGRKWPTGFDFINLTAGSSKELGILAETISVVCLRYSHSQRETGRPILRFRGQRSLGWIPVKGRTLRREGDAFRFAGNTFRVFDPRPLPAGKITDGTNFAQDASGNWFLNVAVEVADPEQRQLSCGVGIDLGLKSFAALSTGETINKPRHFRLLEERLGKAQRAGKSRLARNTHARIVNARRDFLHKLSHRLVREFDYIAVGNVSASKLAKTKMAKSVHDASWSSFRTMLRYKAIAHGAWFEEVNEAFSSQVCSSCGTLPDSRPRGIADLGVRQWTCSSCGAVHERDTNAAINILARHGHVPPAVGIVASAAGMSGCRARVLSALP